jgi:hypothetical protein
MDALVVILNYRTAAYSIDCLRSMADEVASSNSRVVVVEGGSGDGSGREIAQAIADNGWSEWASLLLLSENRGYAAGNNAAIRACLRLPDPPRYIHVVNPDTVARQGALGALIDFMDRHPRVGIAGSQLEDPDGTPQCCAFRFPTPLSELESGLRLGWASRLLRGWRVPIDPSPEAHRADWVAGASMIIRKKVFDDIGLMDEGYFLYYEEVDFCLRAARAGWECWHVPQSRLVHFVGKATGVSNVLTRRGKRRPAYWYESRRRFFVKRYGLLGLIVADAAWGAGRFVLLLRKALRLGGDTASDPKLLTLDLLWGDARAIFSGRVSRIPEIGTRL